MDNDIDDGPPPFTLEVAEEWLHRLEEIATMERDAGFGTRLVLINLIRLLTDAGTFDGRAFIDLIQRNLHRVEQANERLGVSYLLDDLEQALLPGRAPDGGFWH